MKQPLNPDALLTAFLVAEKRLEFEVAIMNENPYRFTLSESFQLPAALKALQTIRLSAERIESQSFGLGTEPAPAQD